MPIFKTFAKRKQEAENAGKPVVYRYDYLPRAFRVQVTHLWRDVVNAFPDSHRPRLKKAIWGIVHDILAREMGVFELASYPSDVGDRMEDCTQFLLESNDINQVLSLIELSFRLFDKEAREYIAKHYRGVVEIDIDDVLKELNYRLCEHGIGYQYESEQIIAVNSQYLHSQTVEPAITLLHDAGFEGALQEFMTAHKHYRARNYKEAIVNASNAFESAMRTICDSRGWVYPQNATASKLIDVMFDNNFVSSEMKSHFTSLGSTLTSGVPTIRNKRGQGGHGQGSTPVEVPDHIAAYALHLTASNIVFLVESHKALDR